MRAFLFFGIRILRRGVPCGHPVWNPGRPQRTPLQLASHLSEVAYNFAGFTYPGTSSRQSQRSESGRMAPPNLLLWTPWPSTYWTS